MRQIDEKAAEYIKENGFKKRLNKTKDLRCLFEFAKNDFVKKDEAHRYWYDLYEKLEEAIKEHGI